MPRTAKQINLSDTQINELNRMIGSGKTEARKVLRAKIILACAEGRQNIDVAGELSLSPLSMAKWRNRFATRGFSGLEDAPRNGKPPIAEYGFLRDAIIGKLSESPPEGCVKRDGKILAGELGISKDRVWRVLRKEGNSGKTNKFACGLYKRGVVYSGSFRRSL